MDILTPKGQETLKQDRMAVGLFTSTFPKFQFVETPKDRPALIDGFIHQEGILLSGVEVKCRNMTASDLAGKFKNRWLITHEKVEQGISLCNKLGVDYRGFLYLVPDRLLMVVPIWAYGRGFVSDIEIEETVTQATVNGGTALRLNAFIDVSRARVIHEA